MESRQDTILTGSLRPTVFYLALPVLLEQLLAFAVGFVDTWLSGALGAGATASVGVGSYVAWLAWMLFGIISVGTTAMVSRAWGAGNYAEARKVTNCSLALAVVMGGIVGVAIALGARPLIAILGRSPEVLDQTVFYIRGIAICFPAFCFITVAGAALRGAGFMQTPMWVMMVVNIFNVILSPALVFGWGIFPELVLTGIITGTVISEYLGALILFVLLWRGQAGLCLNFSEWALWGDISKGILRIGFPAAWDGLLTWIGQFMFLLIVSSLDTTLTGASIFAAHIICVRIEGVTYLPAMAWGQAAATIVGQSLGAGDKVRARKAGHEATFQCCLLAAGLMIFFYFGSELIYSTMHSDPQVISAGAGPFKLVAFFQIPLAISIVYVIALRGAGETKVPLLINLVGIYFIRLPLAWLLGVYYEGGLLGAWTGMCIDTLFRAILIQAGYVWGKWDQKNL